MNRCAVAGSTWSLRATRYQDGMVFHAGAPDGSCSARTSLGRWPAHISSVVALGTSPANTSRKTSFLMYPSTPSP
jgi:hypothetical protein